MRRKVKAVLYAIGLSIAALYLVGVAHPPLRVTRALIRWNGPWMIQDFARGGKGAPSRLVIAARKLSAIYVQYQLAAAVQSRHHVEGNDVERLVAQLRPLHAALLNQREVAHAPANWSTFLTGLGYCDQVNGVAANVLANEFDHSQLIAISDTLPEIAGHVIGRVWSKDRGDWLYYDVWNGLMVFAAHGGSPIAILAREPPSPDVMAPSEQLAIQRFYDLTALGWVMNEYPQSYGAYLFSKVRRDVRQRRVQSLAPTRSAGGGAVAPHKPLEDARSGDDRSFRVGYVEARLQQLLGDGAVARAAFSRLAVNPRQPTALTEVARLFSRPEAGMR